MMIVENYLWKMDRCHKTDGVAYFDFNPGYNGQCKCASDDKCSNGLYTDHGVYYVYSYKECPEGTTFTGAKSFYFEFMCLRSRASRQI